MNQDPFRAAAVQMNAGTDKVANLERAAALVGRAADADARFVVLPEVFLWRGPQEREVEVAETIPGPVTDRLAAIARTCRVHLLAGSLLERAGGGRAFNTSLLFGPDGDIVAAYRKIHLFDVDIPGRVSVRESATRQPGDVPVVARTEIAVLGLSICYDLRFPELYRALARGGATVLCVPAAFTFATGSAHWEVLLRARAIENQAWVIAANQFGAGMGGILNFGHSMIIDPWGVVVAQADGDSEGVIVAEIDPRRTASVRQQLPALAHARMLADDR